MTDDPADDTLKITDRQTDRERTENDRQTDTYMHIYTFIRLTKQPEIKLHLPQHKKP